MRAKHTALFLTAGFLLTPTLIWSQLPGGAPGAGGPGGMRGMFNDPDQLFNMVAKGQEVIRVDQLDAFSKSMFDRFASRYGLTGNEITRDQFKTAFTRIREESGRGQLNFQGGPASGRTDGSRDPDRRLDDRFQRMDRDQDGVLSHEELSETLQGERDKYDSNHDGKIDLNEYRAYVEARVGDARPGEGQRDGRGAGGPAGTDEERKRPTILRAGSLPPDFPYGTIDQQGDNDGQIGLYEWKNAGRRIAEFLPMDLNNDGFMTVDEYYRWRKKGEDDGRQNGSMSGQFARGGRGMALGGGVPGSDRGFGGLPGGMTGMGGDRGDRGGDRQDRGFRGGDRGFGMMGGGMPGGVPTMLGGDRGFGRGPGGDRGSVGMPGGDRGFGRDMGRAPGSERSFGGMTGGPGGDRGSFNGMTPPGGGMTMPSRFAPPGGSLTPPMGTSWMGRDRGFGGDRGMNGDRGERGDRGNRFGPPGGDRGDRPERPRKDRDR